MPQPHQIRKQIRELDPVERAQLLFDVLEEMSSFPLFMFKWHQGTYTQEYPSIVATPNVCGGAARLIRTRIPVWTLERMRQLGFSEIDILRSYPTLRAVDLVQAWSYAARYRNEIEQEIRENEEE